MIWLVSSSQTIKSARLNSNERPLLIANCGFNSEWQLQMRMIINNISISINININIIWNWKWLFEMPIGKDNLFVFDSPGLLVRFASNRDLKSQAITTKVILLLLTIINWRFIVNSRANKNINMRLVFLVCLPFNKQHTQDIELLFVLLAWSRVSSHLSVCYIGLW